MATAPRSYFDGLSTRGPDPSDTGYGRVSSGEGGMDSGSGAGMTDGEGWGRLNGGEVGGWWADALDPSRGLGMTV